MKTGYHEYRCKFVHRNNIFMIGFFIYKREKGEQNEII